MKKLASVAVIPIFAGFLWAQSDQVTKTETTTTKTTYNGTLMDAGCLSKHTERSETTSTNTPGQTTTSTKTETTNQVTECPVTTTTTTFALQTPEGQYVRFDEPSNTRIVEVVKGNKTWTELINDRKPLKVRIVGAPKGEVVVLESIQ
jgi:hypothetical protein